ncbi:MAG TPA: alpha/beta fold hydrolase [Rhizomicrobium sp.]|nr:alpha/beta fold hydrolase [Rhizomicrobium sp.]
MQRNRQAPVIYNILCSVLTAGTMFLFAAPSLAEGLASTNPPPIPRLPQEEAIAAAPLPYREEPVVFDNPAASGVRLAGTLTLPNGNGPFAAVLLIAGSGRNTRDEPIHKSDGTESGHKPMLVLADALARQGYAVLRYDKRGAGKSSGNYDAATMMDFLSDARAALAWLGSRPEIDKARLAIVGHSEGAEIGALMAADDPAITGVVMMAGFAEPENLLVAEQIRRMDIANGKPPAEAAQTYALNLKLFDAIATAKDQAEGEARVVKILATANPPPDNAEIHQTLLFARLPMMRFLLGYNPEETLEKIRVPVLALGGTKDLIALTDINQPALRKALARDADVTIVEMPGLNHFFQHAQTGLPSEMSGIEETLAPEVMATIIPWLAKHMVPEARTSR